VNVRLGAILLAVGLASAGTTGWAEDIQSGPTERTGGPFQVKAVTGDNADKQLCYV